MFLCAYNTEVGRSMKFCAGFICQVSSVQLEWSQHHVVVFELDLVPHKN